MTKKILVVIGTRPEAIKMAPVIQALRRRADGLALEVCVTRQHSELLDPVLDLFGISPAYDIGVMKPGQSLSNLTAAILAGLETVYRDCVPSMVLVHGDTTTTLGATLGAFYNRIPVAHVEAGLRTSNVMAPWPEELNRRLTGAMAKIHFAPTEGARDNLRNEGIPDQNIFVTGNTVVDALLQVVERMRTDASLRSTLDSRFPKLEPGRRLILVTGHRRENFGEGFRRVCSALARLASRPDVQLIYPVHLNPNVREPVFELLGHLRNVHLIEPVDYLSFVYLMEKCHFIISDSGGIQEEAPALRKPVLVMRDVTERPEAVAAGFVELVGTDEERIVSAAEELLQDEREYVRRSGGPNPFGDGTAAEKIASVIAES